MSLPPRWEASGDFLFQRSGTVLYYTQNCGVCLMGAQLNLLSPVPKTYDDDNVYAYSPSSPVYGINLELFFKEDLNLATHGKCLCQEFKNMLVHYVKTAVLIKHFTLHHQRTVVWHECQHVPPGKVFRKCCDQLTCINFFFFSCVKDRSHQYSGLATKIFFLWVLFPKKQEKNICFEYDHMMPERNLPI